MLPGNKTGALAILLFDALERGADAAAGAGKRQRRT